MNEELTWRSDVAVIEWLIVLAMLVILAGVGTVVTRQTLNNYRLKPVGLSCGLKVRIRGG